MLGGCRYRKNCIPISVHENCKGSVTRWSCRYAACKTIRDRLQAVLQLIAELSSGDNAHRAVEARCLLKAIESHFVVTLILMCDIFGRTNALCCMMQSSTLDLSRAVELIDATYDELVENRATDVHFDKVRDDGVNLCQVCNMELNTSTPVVSEQSSTMGRTSTRERRLPTRFQDSVVMETVGDHVAVNNKAKASSKSVLLRQHDK